MHRPADPISLSSTIRRVPQTSSHVVIVGGGFSGTMLAVSVLRLGVARVTLIERRSDQLARGVAYNAASPEFLLNVRAENMSALADKPRHFVEWLERRGAGNARSFAARSLYGRYLEHILQEAIESGEGRLHIVNGDVHDVAAHGAAERVMLSDGRTIDADAVILAAGNLPPRFPAILPQSLLDHDLFAQDPWAGSIVDGLGDDDHVLLLGTGLTAVDAALLLKSKSFRGRITALSRRGLLPRGHSEVPRDAAPMFDKPAPALSEIVRFMRQRADRRGWRDAVDDLRPITQLYWEGADNEARARFLRHLRPYWDVHRHRLAPGIAASIGDMLQSGRLRTHAGRIVSARPATAGVWLQWHPRGGSIVRNDRFRRIVNCIGPESDPSACREPLMQNLLKSGRITVSPLRLGMDTDVHSRVIDAAGRVRDSLFAIGPMTKGRLWEVVAVPDIRIQVSAVARRVTSHHWVEGEGL